jgi:hypothetical protein
LNKLAEGAPESAWLSVTLSRLTSQRLVFTHYRKYTALNLQISRIDEDRLHS